MDLDSILNKKTMSSQFDPITDQHTKRCKINTGHLCNADCHFCYYQDSRRSNLRFELIEKQLLIAKRFGMESVDFSGGEPTTHMQFKKMIRTAKDLGFKDICVITNGLTFHRKQFLKECMDLGLNDILLSFHGVNQDEVLRVFGAYSKALATMKNANELGIRLRVNSVISNLTWMRLVDLTFDLRHYDIYNYNMIMFKYCFDQRNSTEIIGHADVARNIKLAIDMIQHFVKVINVRYIPFCLMRDYEEYVTNFHQKKYDPLEWNNALFFRFENVENICLDFLDRDKVLENNDAIEKYSVADYRKAEQCLRCKHFLICDGFETAYADLRNISAEAKPEPGKKIKDPLYYRRQR